MARRSRARKGPGKFSATKSMRSVQSAASRAYKRQGKPRADRNYAAG